MKNLWIGALTALIVLSACQGGKKPVDTTATLTAWLQILL